MKGAIGDDGGGRGGVERHGRRGRGEGIGEKETFRSERNLTCLVNF